ncbi:MAG: hypothetical protein ABF384_17375 [Verrucomicrobiales bacterium]|jgi:hypothetical protein
MEPSKAIEIVSCKRGLKLGLEDLDDSVMGDEVIRRAISDEEKGEVREIVQ